MAPKRVNYMSLRHDLLQIIAAAITAVKAASRHRDTSADLTTGLSRGEAGTQAPHRRWAVTWLSPLLQLEVISAMPAATCTARSTGGTSLSLGRRSP